MAKIDETDRDRKSSVENDKAGKNNYLKVGLNKNDEVKRVSFFNDKTWKSVIFLYKKRLIK